MAGKNSTQPVDPKVLAAMMNDLGNHRIEEQAQDDDHRARHGPTFHVNTTQMLGPAKRLNRSNNDNSIAAKFHAAIKNGLFDDDDAAGVSGLDPLDGGNAHRIRHHAIGQWPSQNQTYYAVESLPKRPTYDPSQPTYHRSSKSNKLGFNPNYQSQMNSRSDTHNLNPRVSSLGGVVPEGAEVRRWDSGRPTDAVRQVDNPFLTRPTGQEPPASSRKESHRGLPAQAIGRGHGPVEHHVNPLQTPIHLPQDAVGRGHGKPVRPQRSPASEVLGSAHPSVSLSSPNGRMIDQTPAAGPNSNHSTSWLPPHLRKTSENQSSTSQNRTVSQETSAQLSEATAGVIVLGENGIRKSTTLDAREIFYEKDVSVFRANNKPGNGRIVIYELLDAPVGIWELTIEDKTVIRGDVRNLQEMLTDGSKAFIRRLNNGRVQSDQIRFSDINEANIFKSEVNLRRGQYPHSASTHTETTIELSPVHNMVPSGTAVEVTKSLEHATAVAGPAEPGQQRYDSDFSDSLQPKKVTVEENTAEKHATDVYAAKKHTAVEHPAEKLKRAWAVSRREFEYRPRTPPMSLTAAFAESTLAEASDEQVQSGGYDNDLIRLSPYSSAGSSKSDELVKHKPLQPAVAELHSLWEETGSPSVLPSEQQAKLGELISIDVADEETEVQQEKGRISAADATRALRDIKIIDDVSVPTNGSGNTLELPWMDPADYARLARKSELLAMALGPSSSSTRSAVFLTSLLHLVEIDEFLDLPYDEQKKNLTTLYTIIRQSAPRIVRTQNEIFALRSNAVPCPEAIKKLNALVKGSGGKQRKSTPQPPAYHFEMVAAVASANHAFLHGPHGNDSLIGQTSQDTTATNPRPILEEPAASQSFNMLGNGSKGLLKSRWASDGTENPEQQSPPCGEKLPIHSSLSPTGLERVVNEAIVDGKANNSHGRLATPDTMATLADQLRSLSLSYKHN
ncbi:hypothetical protein F5Y14DRAFT_462322 [Nemania sp. NC0429]|nr:hypothetical protein F5Y14DRAFT_462322 [Nemania sp. NC0429]